MTLKKRGRTISLLLILILGLALFLVPLAGYAEDPEPIVYRGDSYIDTDFGDGTHSWESAPLWIFNGSDYVPYIYSRDEAKKCYLVQSGLIGAEIYDTGIAKFYDPDLTEERVKSEIWDFWAWDGKEWKKATLSFVVSFNVIQEQKFMIIEAERATSKPDGVLTVQYRFFEGRALKHNVYWESASTLIETVQIRQVWDLKLSTDKVVLDNGDLLTTSTKTNSTTYLFGDGENDFLVSESQWSATYYPNGILRESGFIEADIDFSGKKVVFTFGNYSVAPGETLEIDPDTATLDNPTVDAYIELNGAVYTKYDDVTEAKIGYRGFMGGLNWVARAYVEWDVSSIPNEATINDVLFKYEGVVNDNAIDMMVRAMAYQPSVRTDEQNYNDAGDGTQYLTPDTTFVEVGTQKIVGTGGVSWSDLTTLKSDLISALVNDWFALGFQGDQETYLAEGVYTDQYCQEEDSDEDPAPTLYVEYTIESASFSVNGIGVIAKINGKTNPYSSINGVS